MDIKEIEKELYKNSMRIRSIESEIGRVSPFSEEFDSLVNESLKLQERQKQLGAERVKMLTKSELIV